VIINELISNLGLLKTDGILAKSTFANGGYIININPMAKGILVVPTDSSLIPSANPSNPYPKATPIPIAKKIQSVRYLSKNFNRVFI
jgi:hypothetical protein